MRRFFALLAIVVSIALIAVACGDDDDDTTIAGEPTQDAPTDSNDPDPEPEPDQDLPVNDGDEPPMDDPQTEPGDSDEPIPVEPDGGIGDGAEPLPDEPLGGGPYPIADLAVTYDHPDVGTLEYRITCLGDTATLTGDADGLRDQTACLQLANADVQQRLVDGPPADQICTEQYGGPETARVVGTIDDQPVDTTFDRANGCGIHDWEVLMAGILPAAR